MLGDAHSAVRHPQKFGDLRPVPALDAEQDDPPLRGVELLQGVQQPGSLVGRDGMGGWIW